MSLDKPPWELLGFILASGNRRKVLFILEHDYATPSQISQKTGIRIGHISNILIDLRKKGLVECKNPDAKRGRIYSLTKQGKDVLDSIKQLDKSN